MPITLIKVVLVTILLSMTICGFSVQDERLTEIYTEMVNVYDSMNRFTVEFTQNNYWRRQDLTIESNGWIYVSDEKIALIYSKPPGQKVIYDEVYYIIDDRSKTVMITDNYQTGSSAINPSEIIKHYWQDSKLELIEEDSEKIKIEITPVDDQHTALVTVEIDKNSFLIKSVAYEDHQKNRVRFSFDYKGIGEAIDDQVFQLEWDDSYSVIR